MRGGTGSAAFPVMSCMPSRTAGPPPRRTGTMNGVDVQLTSPSRRVFGLLAAGTIGLSTALLGVTGVAYADPADPTVAPAVAAALTVPSAPTGLRLSEVGDREATFYFQAGPYDANAQDATTGYQVSTDNGVNWVTLQTHDVAGVGIFGTVENLTNGQTYPTKVRATSLTGPGLGSAPLDVTPAKPIGAPGGLTVTTSPGSVTASWTAPTAAGTFGIDGYQVVFFQPETEDGGGAGGPLCETTAAVHTCSGDLAYGDEWQISVYAVDTEGNPGESAEPVASGKIPFPVDVPTSNGPLTPGAGSPDKVVAGKTMVVTGSGYAPGSTVTVLIYSSPQVLTTTVADASGNFTVTVTVPAGLPAGQHTLVASGVDTNGDQRFMTLPVTVAATGVATVAGPALPYTGADVLLPGLAGLGAVTVGAGLIVVRRRAARSAA
jgi:LPXTG-motif cell wall-anchored protein